MSTEEEKKKTTRPFKGAQVNWPPDMPDRMLEFVINLAHEQLTQFDFERDGVEIAKNIKTAMDQEFEPYWHVFVGKNFGCQAVHEQNRFVYFTIQQQVKISFLCYKAS